MRFLLLAFLFFLLRTEGEDSVSVLKSKSHETALLGDNITLKCNLTITSATVLQITWQKLKGFMPENIGTYSIMYGEKIHPPYNKEFHYKSSELTSSSVTIYNVTLEDEACYKCLFNVFPNGIHGGQICFSVQYVSELKTELLSHPIIEGIVIVICSATGKPAPQITLSSERVLIGSPNASIDRNPDGTATVTQWYNISLKAMRSLKLQNVSCNMDHPQRKEKILVSLPQELDSIHNNTFWRSRVALIPPPLIFLTCLVILFVKQKKKCFRKENTEIVVSDEKAKKKGSHGARPKERECSLS